MRHAITAAAVVLAVWLLAAGCADRGRVETAGDGGPEPQPLRTDEGTIDRRAHGVITARNTTEEAEALRRLWQHIADEELTYDLKAYAVDGGRQVESPTAHRGLLRAQLQVFRGNEKIYQFSFIPRENSNLSIIGATD